MAFVWVVLTPQPSRAAPGDANASGVTLGLNANLLGVPLVNLSGTVGTAVAPAAGGTSSTGILDVGAVLGTGIGVTAGGTVTDITATRTATQSSASAEIAGVTIGVLGINAVQTGVVRAQAICPAGGTPTSSASVTNLVLLGQAVTLNAATPTVSVSAAVNVAGLVGARLAATAQQITTTTATGATATAVLVSLTLTATVGLPTTLNLGTVQLASASCTAPNAAASSLSPSSGPTRGGTTVTITGAGLQNTTGVTFGGVPATGVTAAADGSSVTAIAPASETTGAVPVSVLRPTGNLTAGTFTYVAPAITAVSPPQGSTAGGTQVTLTGTGLLGATGVSFGGTAGTIVGAPTDTSITVTTPARPAGAVAVTAVLPGADATIADGFTYVTPTAPIITGFTPAQGVAAGGTTVTFAGSNLAAVTAVTFGGTAATIVGTPTATSLTVTTLAHAPGPVDVVLSGTGGTTTAPGQYTYLDDGSQATITGISPDTVPTSGGTELTISGTGLAGATGVTVNGVPATLVSVAADSVVATAPASETAGPVTVQVQFPAGERSAGTIDYTTPAITAVDPDSGPAAGGTTLTLTGTGLAPVTEVTIGGAPATVVGTPADTTLTVTTAAHAPATVDVVAVLPGADATAPDAFTYLADGTGATVTGIDPATSPTSGGGTLTVTGSGLDGVTALTIGGQTATDLVVAPDGTTVTATVPATETAGAAPVQLVFPAGTLDAGTLVYAAPAITAVTPSQGPDEGGTDVTLTGTGFTGATDLLLDGESIPFTVASDTELTFTTPAHAAGLVDLTVVLPGLDVTAAGGFAFLLEGVAAVDAVTPAEGPTSGGTTVTVTGANLGSVTEVLFDGVPATIVGTPTAGSLTVTSPAHPAPGPVTLTLTNEGGDSWVPGGFTYLADGTAASVDSLTPAQVPTAGGTTVTITGSGLSGATGILVGGEPAADVVVAADGSSLTFTAPATETPGAAPVVIQFPLGDAAAGDLEYLAPTLDALDPAQGPVSGGTTVTLTGTGLERATGVTFAGTAATGLTVTGPGAITVATPALPAGTVDVLVELPGADAALADAFTYLDDGSGAEVTGLSPDTLPTAGGTVTVTGTGLGGATAVTVGGVTLTGLTVSDTAITGTLPPGETGGAQAVEVVFPAGTVAAGELTLVAPELTAVSPSFGITSGGNTLTLSGSGLTGAEAVLVGGESATVLTASDTELTVTAPAHQPGVVDVVVQFPGADAALPLSYTYLDDGTGATFTGIAPEQVPTSGGVPVTVTGTGLQNAFGVTVGGRAATDVQVNDEGTAITFTVPSAEVAGPATVSVWFPAGAQVAGQLAYLGPEITAITPAEGPASGGTEVTIEGTGLTGATAVRIGGDPATVLANTGTTLRITTPAGTAGPADLVVELDGADATAAGGFTYLEDGSGVEVTDLAPATSSTGGGGTLTVTGTGLDAVTAVTIGGTEATDLAVDGDGTELTVTIPASETAGSAPVVLVLPAGTLDAGELTYVAPTLTDISPAQGPAAGGTGLTLTGTGFTGATEVSIGGVPATFTVASDTEITAPTPAHAPGTVDVVIALPGADATAADGFEYLEDGSGATVTGLAPATTSTAGGGTLTVTGTGLSGATGVTVGGVAAQDLTVAGDGSTITVTIPAADAAGPVAVVIEFPAGTLDAGTLTYVAPAVTGVSPAEGPTGGDTLVTITGTGLSGATGVSFGGAAGIGLTVVSDSELTVRTPSSAAGVVDVVVELPGADVTVTGGYEYLADGTGVVVDGLSPATSPVAGGGTLTVTGSGLDAVTTVTIGGVEATGLTVDGDTLTVTIPASEVTGELPVLLTTPGGDVLAGGLTYTGSTVTGLAPEQGPAGGGTEVTVTGTDLGAVTAVQVDGLPATDVDATGGTVTFTTPAHAVGTVTVVLVQPGLDVTLDGAFTYLDDGSGATVDAIDPDQVPLSGGVTVTLTGTGLSGATGVTVDGVAAEDVVVAEDGTGLTFTAPAGTDPGTATVEVVFPAGALPAGDLTYADDGSQATVGSLTPALVPTHGGDQLVISGSGLDNVTGVRINDIEATGLTVAGDGSSVTVTVPPSELDGAVPVLLTFPAGTVSAGQLGYEPPSITSVTPPQGPDEGGTTVTIDGGNLGPATRVLFDGVPGTAPQVTSPQGPVLFAVPSTLTVVAPEHEPGLVEVTVELPGQDAVLADGYGYLADDGPTVEAIDPGTGPTTGGTEVTLTGTGLDTLSSVTFDGLDATILSASPDTAVVSTPAHDVGPVDVAFTNQDGTTVLPGAFSYDDATGPGGTEDPLTVTAYTPRVGPASGGQTVTITGTGFVPGDTVVTFNGVSAAVTVLDADVLLAVTPANPVGTVPLVVTAGVQQSATLSYQYVADAALPGPPVVTGSDPGTIPSSGGIAVTLGGSGFVPGATSVYLCGQLIPADQVTVSGDGTVLTFTAPPCSTGAQTAIVITPGGTTAVTLTYVGDAAWAVARSVDGLNPWRLATTGAPTGGTPWAALLLVVAGAGLLVIRRAVVRRRARSAIPIR
nr:IPT/TIG domain-containing protein [Cellulomonas denverensis]